MGCVCLKSENNKIDDCSNNENINKNLSLNKSPSSIKNLVNDESRIIQNPFLLRSTPIRENYLIEINAEYFANDFFDEINKARQNCKSYSYKISKLKDNIQIDEDYLGNFLTINNKRVNLSKGKEVFEESSKFLENLYNKLESNFKILKKLEFIDELRIPFPEEENISCMCIDSFYVSSCVEKLRKKFEGKYIILDYIFQISINDPEIFTFLSCIGENQKNMELLKIIFDEEIRFISINHKAINGNKCFIYLLFAKEVNVNLNYLS